jgi:hypothetical protein
MFHVGIVTKTGNIIGKEFLTRAEADDYILKIDEQEGVRRADILNKDTGERERIKL